MIIDADLQNPPEVILFMIKKKWREGFNVVYGRRIDRNLDSAMRKFFTNVFYKIYNTVSTQLIIEGTAEFCLIDRCTVNAIVKMGEIHRFMRRIFSWVGFRTVTIWRRIKI